MARLKPLMIEHATIAFRNFAGKEGAYNQAGARNFLLFIDANMVEGMLADGWNVKFLKPRDDDEVGQAYIQCAVNYKGPRPPHIVMITSRGRSDIGEDEVNILDWVEIKHVDIVVNPYEWEIPGPGNTPGKSGVKAYVKTLFIAIEEDALELKYADMPDSARNAIPEDSADAPPWA